jgi:hypothetical protein
VGVCLHCGQQAGLLRSKHQACTEKYEQGWAEMLVLVKHAASGETSLDDIEGKLAKIAEGSYIPASRTREALVSGWEKAVEHFLEDGNLDSSEEKCLETFQNRFSLGQADLDRQGAYTKLVKASVLRELMEGKIPERMKVRGNLPFMLQKAEQLVWVFPDVTYYEDRTRRQYVGGSHGVSFRIARGVYYRVGAFRGNAVETTEKTNMGTGILGITNKHIYFAGAMATFRTRLDKIISIVPFSDGIGIQRDGATAKPQVFVTGDRWFTYNMLMNLSNL